MVLATPPLLVAVAWANSFAEGTEIARSQLCQINDVFSRRQLSLLSVGGFVDVDADTVVPVTLAVTATMRREAASNASRVKWWVSRSPLQTNLGISDLWQAMWINSWHFRYAKATVTHNGLTITSRFVTVPYCLLVALASVPFAFQCWRLIRRRKKPASTGFAVIASSGLEPSPN